ncbi:MAG: hypothetical protein AAB495_02015 [Patescibacteria group bacterium]
MMKEVRVVFERGDMATEKRLADLRAGFSRHPSVVAGDASLQALSEGYAEIEMVVSENMLVVGDLPPGLFAQGGFVIGVLPNFAGVYAAMTLIQGHALLVAVDGVRVMRPSLAGEKLRASAHAERDPKNNDNISVSWTVESVEGGEVKAVGYFTYRTKRSDRIGRH